MKRSIAWVAAAFLMGQAIASPALADDIFVRETRGYDLSRQQQRDITEMVKLAVQDTGEHSLVTSESSSDFVLAPSIVTRNDQMYLRVEKRRDGNLLAVSEQPIDSIDSSRDLAMSATERALSSDDFPASDDSMSGTTGEASVGEVTAPSPFFGREDRTGYFNIGVGPAFPIGLDSDSLMYNINVGYNVPFSDVLVGSLFGDFNLGTGSDTSRFINIGLAAEVSTQGMRDALSVGHPYFTADIGYAFTRNQNDLTKDAPAIGAGAGFRFQANDLNVDLNLHYSVLTAQLEGNTPQVLGLRAAVNF